MFTATDHKPMRVTVATATAMLCISKPTFYKAVKEGRLSIVKEGRKTLVLVTELERYVAASVQAVPRNAA